MTAHRIGASALTVPRKDAPQMTNEDKVRAAGDALLQSLMRLHPNFHGATCEHCAAFLAWLNAVDPIGGEAA